MRTINIPLITITILALLLGPPKVHDETTRATKNLRQDTVLLPASAPDRDSLVLVASIAVISEEEVVGLLILYNHPHRERLFDYIEVYDASGDLLLIHWIDQFGIHRTAIDRGLLDQNKTEAEGILILVEEGIII